MYLEDYQKLSLHAQHLHYRLRHDAEFKKRLSGATTDDEKLMLCVQVAGEFRQELVEQLAGRICGNY